MTSLGQPDRF
jgi:hypothetical protein